MLLHAYKQKRNFAATPEPKGKKKTSKNALVFVVQKHAASHLHYDFRLEMKGVLKSWAVPKGPSMNPNDKRLAMMVEDHPYSYKDFEGTIPEGNYGAGEVIVWDYGTYKAIDNTTDKLSEKKLLADLHKGHLRFNLQGKKLKGEFSLIKLKGKQENAWLLIKKKDQYATSKDVLKQNTSVLSNRSIEKLKPSKNKQKQVKEEEMHHAAFVKKMAPMLAETVAEPFDNSDWIFETKYDGYRSIAFIQNQQVQLFSRKQHSFNTKFKLIAQELEKIKEAVILDGEIVVETKSGQTGFQLLQNYQSSKGQLKYYIFDILYLNGNDIRHLPLLKRKELLQILLKQYAWNNIFYSEHIIAKGKSFFKKAIKTKKEGIIAKKKDSTYESGERSSHWLKIKISNQEEAIITGITEPQGSRDYFGALILAQYKNNKLIYIGHCGTGFTKQTLKNLYHTFQPYFIKTSPFQEKIKVNATVQWIKPKFICQVKFTERTKDGILRHPVFLGLREDKKPSEVQINTITIQKKLDTNMDIDMKMGKLTLHLTNQQKIYFPDDHITKGDLIQYYNSIADLIMPYLKNRPQSMHRYPNGINAPGFYQKDLDIEKIPSWLKSKKIYSESTDEYVDYLLCNDKATLLYMVNLGCIDINPWNSIIQHINNPSWMVIDLDPEKIDFKAVVKTALTVKDVLEELNITCYCKTSGATGLHIYVPLQDKYNYETVKIFAQLIAHKTHLRLPDITSLERMPKKRQRKVYIDYLQNRIGQTLAAAYSIRPKAGATVSTPLEWKEVNNKLSPLQFTIKNILKRIDKKGDLWKPVLGKGVNLDKIIKKETIDDYDKS